MGFPSEDKLELFDGIAIDGDEERDRLILALVYNTGLEHFLNKILPSESKEILLKLCECDDKTGISPFNLE